MTFQHPRQIPSSRPAAFPKGLYPSRCWMESVVERAPRLHVLTHTPLPSSAERANRNTGPWGLEGGVGTLETEENLACFHRGKRGRRTQCRLVGWGSKHSLSSCSGRREHSGKGKAKGRFCHSNTFGLGALGIRAQWVQERPG